MASRETNAVHAARELASATGIQVPMVAKTLKALARRGLVVSHRGSHGGYSLARRADSISLADIVTALEGPIAMTTCSDRADGAVECGLEARCRVHDNWRKLNRIVVEALERVSLDEMARPGDGQLGQLVSLELGSTRSRGR